MNKPYEAIAKPQRPAKRARTILIAALVLFVVGGLFSGYVFYSTVRALVAEADFSLLPNLNVFAPNPPEQNEDSPQVPVWRRTERVNLLLLGADRRPDEKQIYRTDTIMVLTLNPETKSAGMLSLPRDLWVTIPGFEENRINQAYMLGETKKYPGGGPALAMRTVQEFLGIPIHGYVLVDFEGFRKLIDQIGGIDVMVEKAIDDTRYPADDYGFQEVHIPAGLVHMDGELALKYARVRHGSDDIDRAGRQQQVLLAARDRALRLNLLPKLPSLMATVLNSVKTDLQPGEILALAKLANQVESGQIQSRVIDRTMVLPTVTPSGADVLLPQRDKVRILVDEMFTSPAPKNGLEGEGATIEVLNGAGTLGLAAQMAALLKEQGFNVVSVENADRNDYSHTVIIDYAGKPGTVAALVKLLQVSADNVLTELGKQPGPATLRIIVGKDFALPAPQSR